MTATGKATATVTVKLTATEDVTANATATSDMYKKVSVKLILNVDSEEGESECYIANL